MKNTADGKVIHPIPTSADSTGVGTHLLTNSKVAGEAQGDEEGLQRFLQDINEGPKHAQVVKVEKSTIDTKEGEFSFNTS